MQSNEISFGFGLFLQDDASNVGNRGFSGFSVGNEQPNSNSAFKPSSFTVVTDNVDKNNDMNFPHDAKQDSYHMSKNELSKNQVSNKASYPKLHWYCGNSAHFVTGESNIVHIQWNIPNVQQISLMRKLSELS